MSLDSIRWEGLKGLRRRGELELKPLNVIFGKNNSGKTTLARLPLFVAASMAEEKLLYALSFEGHRFGSSFLDLASADQAHPTIRFGAAWSDRSNSLTIRLQHVFAGKGESSVQPSEINLDGSSVISIPLASEFKGPAAEVVSRSLTKSLADVFSARRRYLAGLRNRVVHIPCSRGGMREAYISRDPSGWTADEVPYILHSSPELMKIVSRWCTESLDGMRISLDAAAFAFRIVENKGTAVAISLGHSGRGTQAVLPVVTLLQGVVHGLHAAELVIVEEPEEHLHPSAHANLADLLIACSEQSQTIVETHSENLILRLRRRIAEGRLDRNRLNLVYMRSDGLPERVELDEYGVAANWPAGVFESDVAEAQAMTDARLAALGALG